MNVFKEAFKITGYQSGNHLPVLDGVRGLAVLLVLLFHFFGVGFGWIGVDLFFVLSGFLITGILVDSKGKPHYFKNFYIRRTLRIFPLYYLVLIIFFFLIYYCEDLFQFKDIAYYKNNLHWFFLYMQNWLMGFEGWPKDHVLNHFWSLAIEEQFYLFWPLLIYILPKERIALVSVLLILFSLILRLYTYDSGYTSTPLQYVITPCRLDGLCIGAFIATLIRTNPQLLSKVCSIVFFVTIPLTLILYLSAGTLKYDSIYYLTYGFTVFNLLLGCVLLFCFMKGFSIIQKFLSLPVMLYLGKYSYGIYVYHWVIYQLFREFYKNSFQWNESVSRYDHYYIYGIICTVVTLIISKISYDYFEAPILKLKNKFA